MLVSMLKGPEDKDIADGINDYTNNLYVGLQELATGVNLITLPKLSSTVDWVVAFWKIFRGCDLVHIQYPVESWGTRVEPGILPGFLKLCFNKFGSNSVRLITTFHEWTSMHPLRKLSVVSLALFSDCLLFVSSIEVDAFKRSLFYKLRKPHIEIVPIGSNLPAPKLDPRNVAARRQQLSRTGNDILLGYFGAIYDAKQPLKMLQTLRYMLDLGHSVRLIMVGDFPTDHVKSKQDFFAQLEVLRLTEHINYFGNVEDAAEIALILSSCDIILQLFRDGLSMRRSSFMFVSQLNRPILTTYCSSSSEFHMLKRLRDLSGVTFTAPGANSKQLAEETLKIVCQGPTAFCRPVQNDWRDIALQHQDVYRRLTRIAERGETM